MAEWEVFFFLSVGLIDGHEVVCVLFCFVLFCFAYFLQKIKDDKMKDERERKKERSRDWVCVGGVWAC